MTCRKCQQEHTKCSGHNRAGKACGEHAIPGATVCHLHGGKSPQVKAKIAREREAATAQAAVRRILDDPDAPPVKDPFVELSSLAGRLKHAVDEVGQRASDLSSVGIVTVAGGEQLRAELRLWDLLLGHLRGALNDLIKAGVMERQQQLAEREGALLASVIRGVLDDLGLSEDQRARVPEVVPRHLRAVTE